MIIRIGLLLLMLFSWGQATAGLDLNANDHAARVSYYYFTDPRQRDMMADMGLLYVKGNDKAAAGSMARARNTIGLHAGLMVGSENIRLGGRFFLANPNGGDVFALALGGKGKIQINRRVSLGIFVFYAPETLSTMDSIGYRELGVRFNVHFARSNKFYVGYRNIEVKIDPGVDLELDNDLHIGLDLGI